MGGDALEFNDDWEAWKFLESRDYKMDKGRIFFRPEKKGNMPEDEQAAINYLFWEWDWAYE